MPINKTANFMKIFLLFLNVCLISISASKTIDNGTKKITNSQQENAKLIQLFLSAVNVEPEKAKKQKLELERKRDEIERKRLQKIEKETEMRNSIYRSYLIYRNPSYAFLRDFMPNRPI